MVRWYVESELWGEDGLTLAAAIADADDELRWIEAADALDPADLQPAAPAVLRASIPLAEAALARAGGLHGAAAWVHQPALDLDRYAPLLGARYLNHAHRLLPFGELLPREAELFDALGSQDQLFVRPLAGDKGFEGDVHQRKYWVSDFAALEGRVDPQTEVMVAPLRPLATEWRTVIVRELAICGCEYRHHVRGNRPELPPAPQEVLDFASASAAALAAAAPALFVLDIGRVAADGQLAVIELNAFSSSDLYDCDIDEVVEGVGWLLEG